MWSSRPGRLGRNQTILQAFLGGYAFALGRRGPFGNLGNQITIRHLGSCAQVFFDPVKCRVGSWGIGRVIVACQRTIIIERIGFLTREYRVAGKCIDSELCSRVQATDAGYTFVCRDAKVSLRRNHDVRSADIRGVIWRGQ